MKAIILSAGLGSRLGDLTKRLPKCLLKISGMSLLEWQLRILKRAGCRNITVVIGTKGECWNQEAYDRIRKLYGDILLNFNNTTSENTFSLRIALEEMEPQDFLSVDGDVIFSEDVIRRLILSKEKIAIVSKTASDRSEPGSKVVCDGNKRVLKIGKKLMPEVFPWDIHSGLFKVDGSEFGIVKELISSDLIKFDTGILLNEICRRRCVRNLNISEGWVNINMPADKDKAEEIAKTLDTENNENIIGLR